MTNSKIIMSTYNNIGIIKNETPVHHGRNSLKKTKNKQNNNNHNTIYSTKIIKNTQNNNTKMQRLEKKQLSNTYIQIQNQQAYIHH